MPIEQLITHEGLRQELKKRAIYIHDKQLDISIYALADTFYQHDKNVYKTYKIYLETEIYEQKMSERYKRILDRIDEFIKNYEIVLGTEERK